MIISATLKKQIGAARYRALRRQAKAQGVNIDIEQARILAMASARHPDNPAAAAAFAAIRFVMACNSPVTPEELQTLRDAAYPPDTQPVTEIPETPSE